MVQIMIDINDNNKKIDHSVMANGSSKELRKNFVPIDIYDSTNQNSQSLHRSKSNVSDLSRIISGIRDDIQQDSVKNNDKSVYDADALLMEQLSITNSKQDKNNQKDEILDNGVEFEEEYSIEEALPDKGYAWIIAFAGMLAIFTTSGANNSFGVFLNYYLDNDVFEGATEYDYALIGGMITFLGQLLAPFIIILCNIFGFRAVGFFGLAIQTVGYMVASVATNISTLYLTQGFLVGFSFAFIFIPPSIIIASWFHVKKATAMGIAVSGSGIGGIVFSLSINKLIKVSGNQKWPLRMVGIIAFFTGFLAVILLKPRNYKLQPYSVTLKRKYIMDNIKSIINIKVFNNYAVVAAAFWYSICIMGYTLMLFSLSPFATLVGLSSNQGSILTALINAGQTFGRPGMGLVADRFGRFNVVGIVNLILVIFTFAWWINSTTFQSLAPFSLFLGCIIGVASTFGQPLTTDIISDRIHDFPAVWSGINILLSFFCLVAEVIALAVRNKNSSKPYLHTQIFAGCCFVASLMLVLIMREWMVRKTLKNRLLISEEKLATFSQANAEESGETTLQNLHDRIERYTFMLRANLSVYFYRMFYPIKV